MVASAAMRTSASRVLCVKAIPSVESSLAACGSSWLFYTLVFRADWLQSRFDGCPAGFPALRFELVCGGNNGMGIRQLVILLLPLGSDDTLSVLLEAPSDTAADADSDNASNQP